MPTDSYYIICPYYHKTLGNNLFCEGVAGDNHHNLDECKIKQCFSSRAERNNFIEKYCSGFDYLNCRIALINQIMSDK